MWLQFRLRRWVWETHRPITGPARCSLPTAGEHGSLNCSWPEFSDRRIDCKIGFSPSSLWVGQLLPIDTMPVNELFDPNSDTPDPCALHAEPLVELERLRVDLDRDIGRRRKGGGASQLGEVGESHRDGDGAARHLLFPHPVSRAVCHPK